jgi:hypothetical protein
MKERKARGSSLDQSPGALDSDPTQPIMAWVTSGKWLHLLVTPLPEGSKKRMTNIYPAKQEGWGGSPEVKLSPAISFSSLSLLPFLCLQNSK